MSIPYHAADDPPGYAALLSETLEVPLLGVPVLYSSNSAAVIDLAARGLALWRRLPPALIVDRAPVRVAVIVHPPAPDEPALPLEAPLTVRMHGDCYLAAGGGSLMSAQLASGTATAFVTPALAADEAGLRYGVIERLGLLLAGPRDRAPLPAAGVARNGRAILLVGPAVGPRSTLCYTCVEAGFSLLAADTVYVSLARGLRIWGHPEPLRLPAEASRLFLDLAGLAPGAHSRGEQQISVDIATRWPERLATSVEHATVCFVERAPGQASSLGPVTADRAFATLSDSYEPAPWLGRDQALAVARALTARGAHRLSVGADPASAVALLTHLAELGRW